MSELVIFIVGVAVFAVTVYGAVMAGGLAFTRREIAENDAVWRPTEHAGPKSP